MVEKTEVVSAVLIKKVQGLVQWKEMIQCTKFQDYIEYIL